MEKIKKRNIDTVEFIDVYEDEIILAEFGYCDYYKHTYIDKMKQRCTYENLQICKENNEKVRYEQNNIQDGVFLLNYGRFSYFRDLIIQKYDIVAFGNYRQYNEFKSTYYGHHNIRLYDSTDIEFNLYKGYIEHDVQHALVAIEIIQKLLVENNVRLIMIGNDRLFIERALAIAGKKLNIPVVVLQHGVYDPKLLSKNKMAIYADEFWVWSKCIKEEYCRNFLVEEKDIKVMGYPYKHCLTKKDDGNTILFLGQPYYEYNRQEADIFNKIIKNVANICLKHNIHFIYRMHPSEDKNYIDSVFSDISNFAISDIKDLYEDFSRATVVIGDISSAIIEAGIVNKCVIQIVWNNDIYERLNEQGEFSFTTKVKNEFEDIENAIIKSMNSNNNTHIDSNYLYVNENLEEWLWDNISKNIK